MTPKDPFAPGRFCSLPHNYITSRSCVKCCWGNSIPGTLHQQLRLNLFPNMSCKYLCIYVARGLELESVFFSLCVCCRLRQNSTILFFLFGFCLLSSFFAFCIFELLRSVILSKIRKQN